MFNEKESATALGGITVKEANVALQLLDKAASNGVIQPVEYAILTEWRQTLVDAIQRSVEKNYDVEQAKIRQAQLAAQQAANQQAPQPTENETDKESV